VSFQLFCPTSPFEKHMFFSFPFSFFLLVFGWFFLGLFYLFLNYFSFLCLFGFVFVFTFFIGCLLFKQNKKTQNNRKLKRRTLPESGLNPNAREG
jgi:uncharacterized membrane protein